MPAAPDGSDGVYLCGHSRGLQPRSAAARVELELQRWAQRGIGAYFEEPAPWYPYPETVRPALARLVGATPEVVVAMNALTVNLHLMLATFYRPTATRRRILIEAGAFPSDRYAVMSQIELHRLDPYDTLVTVAPRDGERTLRTDDIESLLDRQGDDIALGLLPGVQFQTGQRLDLQRIAATARRCGCRVGFDLAHAVGNVPLALHDWNVDFAVWCSYKYLNAGPGAVAGCIVHARHDASQALPRLAGWWGTDPDTRFVMRSDDRFLPQRGAAGWQVSNPPILALATLGASIEMFDEVGLEALRDRSLRLTGGRLPSTVRPTGRLRSSRRVVARRRPVGRHGTLLCEWTGGFQALVQKRVVDRDLRRYPDPVLARSGTIGAQQTAGRHRDPGPPAIHRLTENRHKTGAQGPRWSTLRRALIPPRLVAPGLRFEPDTCRDLLLFAVQCQEGHGPAVRTEDQRTGQVPQRSAP